LEVSLQVLRLGGVRHSSSPKALRVSAFLLGLLLTERRTGQQSKREKHLSATPDFYVVSFRLRCAIQRRGPERRYSFPVQGKRYTNLSICQFGLSKLSPLSFEDATGLSRGVITICRYTTVSQGVRLDATALRRGDSRSQLNSSRREAPRDKPVAS